MTKNTDFEMAKVNTREVDISDPQVNKELRKATWNIDVVARFLQSIPAACYFQKVIKETSISIPCAFHHAFVIATGDTEFAVKQKYLRDSDGDYILLFHTGGWLLTLKLSAHGGLHVRETYMVEASPEVLESIMCASDLYKVNEHAVVYRFSFKGHVVFSKTGKAGEAFVTHGTSGEYCHTIKTVGPDSISSVGHIVELDKNFTYAQLPGREVSQLQLYTDAGGIKQFSVLMANGYDNIIATPGRLEYISTKIDQVIRYSPGCGTLTNISVNNKMKKISGEITFRTVEADNGEYETTAWIPGKKKETEHVVSSFPRLPKDV
ncbi:hypothetical protein [Vibrio phage vB_pir03]|nr:hypothetical protein [Vibrio phage vB_pir03]